MNFKEVECGLVSSSTGLVLVTGCWELSGCIEARDFFFSIFSTSVLIHSLHTLVLTLYSPNYACVLPAV